MKLDDIKIGMPVKVIGKEPIVPDSVLGNIYKVKVIDDHGEHWIGLDVKGDGKDGIWWFDPMELEPVPRSNAARIRTDKIIVDGIKCRKVISFEGILGHNELPKEYLKGYPAFWIEEMWHPYGHVFQNGEMRWANVGTKHDVFFSLPPWTKIDVGKFNFAGIQEGSIWPEATWQELVKWMKRAGARLAAIRKREKDSWKGEEVVEI